MHKLYSTRVEAPNTIDDCHRNDFVSLNPQGRLGDDEQQDINVAVHTVNRNILSPKFTTEMVNNCSYCLCHPPMCLGAGGSPRFLTGMGGCLTGMGGCLTGIGGCLTGIVTEIFTTIPHQLFV